MATFQVQVEGLTGLSIGTSPTAAELAEFLKDGVIDVTSRCVQLKPQTREDFVRASSTQSSNGFTTSGADILSVIREAGADGDTDGSTAWRNCRKVSSHLRSRVVDTESLHFASKYSPVYIINNNSAVNVYPVPDGTNDGYRVYYINNEPKGDGLVDELAAGHTTIGYFPKDKVYLVVIYAGIKSLQNALSAVDISSFSLTAVPPDVPTLSESSVTITGTAPTYTAPSLDASSDQITEMEAGTIGSAQTDTEQWFDVAGDFIETEEDSELAAAQLQKISAYLQAYSASMQNQMHKFNDANVEYQATLQKNIKDADFDNQEEARLLQKYGAEVQEYQAEVAAEVQTYQQEVAEKATEYQGQTARLQDLKQEYAQAFAIMAPPPQAQQPQRRARR